MAAYYKCKSTNDRRLDIMDKRLKLILEKVVKGLSDEEVDTLFSGLGINKKLLEELADDVKDDERLTANIKALDTAQDNGDGAGKAMSDIVDSHADTAAELYKNLQGDDAELYNDDEEIELGHIANAIKDRWQ